jgi:hypothetical protein
MDEALSNEEINAAIEALGLPAANYAGEIEAALRLIEANGEILTLRKLFIGWHATLDDPYMDDSTAGYDSDMTRAVALAYLNYRRARG